jgi:hypothetical protein
VQTNNPSTRESKAGGLCAQGQPGLHRETLSQEQKQKSEKAEPNEKLHKRAMGRKRAAIAHHHYKTLGLSDFCHCDKYPGRTLRQKKCEVCGREVAHLMAARKQRETHACATWLPHLFTFISSGPPAY